MWSNEYRPKNARREAEHARQHLPDPTRGYGEYPACTSWPWEARPASASEGV